MIMKIVGAVALLILVILGLFYAFASWGTIPAGSRGIVLHMSAVTGEIKGEGFYTKSPWTEHVVAISVQNQKEQTETEGASKDLQTVKVAVALNFSLLPTSVATMYQTVGVGYVDTVIAPSMQESVKAVLAQFTAEELISKREIVRENIHELLSSKLTPMGIKIEAINIVNFDFSASFNAAIEAKVTAEQSALAAKNKLEQVKFEAQQKIEEAMGKAKAMSLEAEAMKNSPQILQLRALEKWDGKMPQVVGGALPFINIDATQGK